ncbi:MAG: Crp/Fnr family transcriptional regulator [Burkholderiaceae bacterium]|nr:Crp/Fnr family transcriptional regulator [Burkholderiaceae bacterium]
MPITPHQLQQSALFRDLPEDALGELANAAMERRLTRREVVISKGEALKFFPLLTDGRLQGVDFTVDGREVGLYFVGPGEYFGELSLIDRQAMAETVIALAPSVLLMLPRERTRSLMFSTPEVAEKVALRLTARLRGEAAQRLLLALPNPMQRLCAQLLNLARDTAVHEAAAGMAAAGASIPFAPTHQEIAIMINASRETVTRAFQQLQNQQILQRDGTRLVILNAAMLQQLSSGGEGR